MVACLEKTEGYSDFHEIVDFLASSSIHHTLTISPPIYTSYIEQFWNTAISQTVNDVKQINANVDSKAVVVTEASIRSFLLFKDADGTACLTNEAIFQNLGLIGYKAEGKGSGEPTKPQFTPSPTQPGTGDQPPETSSSHATSQDSRDSLEGTNGNEEDQALFVLCTNLSNKVFSLESIKDAQAAKISALKSRIKKLEKKCKPSISHHKVWLKSVNKLSTKNRFGKKESVSKQGKKKSKPESTLDDSTVFDDQDADHEVIEDKGSSDKGGNAEELVSTARPDIDAARQEDSAVEPRTPPKTTSIFDDEDIIMAQTLIKMKEEKAKEKGVLIKDVDDSSRPARSILTLKPLLTIDPKDKARLIHEKELVEIEMEKEERQRQDQASVDYIASLYDEVQAKMEASEELVARLQMEERERERDVHNRRKALYIKEQERDVDFMPIGSERDEKMIDKMNKKAASMDEEEVPEEPESTKVEVKQEGREENIKKRSGRRLKMKATKKSKRQKTDSDIDEEEQLRPSLKIVPDEEEEIDYEVLGMRVFRANGSSRYIKTFTKMVSRFDRLDFIDLHSLVMQRFSTTTPEGIDLVLWGDLRIMFEETADDDIWKNQEKWIIKSWTFYENYRVHILALEDGTKIHILSERRYPLIRETIERMMELRMTVKSEGEAVFDMFRFIQKQIDEFGGQDGKLASPKQMALGKDISNPLIVGSLLKTIWFIQCTMFISNEALAILEQTATGKEISNLILPDYEDFRARGFVHRSLDLQSFACLYMEIRYPRSY
ncbi:hypothetical protein Tco_0098876 [Tanacetum coccineum]